MSESRSSESSNYASITYKGRGATLNPASRYSDTHQVTVADGWAATDPQLMDKPQTQAFPDRTVRLITTNKSPDIGFDQSINPYKGCEHGCVYCFARPTHAYLDLSPGLDFETKIFYKTNVASRLLEEISHPDYQPKVIAMGTNTDPYQPMERSREITRQILQLLLEHRHPVSIVTKSQLILRDLDVLSELAAHNLVNVKISITTLSNELKTKLEPRTPSPSARLRTVKQLRTEGIPVGVLLAPVIPYVNDDEIEAIVAASVEQGAQSVRYILLRLPHEVKDLFRDWLDTHYPLRAARVFKVIKDTRGGKAYDATWGRRMTGQGAYAELIAARFKQALKKNNLLNVDLPAPSTELFLPPQGRQADMFAPQTGQSVDE